MNLTLENLPEEKRRKIIQICIEEFSKQGYKSTSTNTLVERAGISKGLLFHYFKNKKTLFLYIFETCMNEISEELRVAIAQVEEDDFFHRLKEIIFKKIEVLTNHFDAYKFITKAMTDLSQLEFQDELQQIILKNAESFNVYEQLSSDVLQNDIKKETAQEIVQVLLEHLGNKYLQLYNEKPKELLENPSMLIEELDEYFKIMKYGLYKK